MTDLADLMNKAMARKGLTQTRLAKITGVSLDVIHRLCAGSRGTSICNALAISAVLGIDITAFDQRAKKRAARKKADRASRRRGGPQRPAVASPSGDVARTET